MIDDAAAARLADLLAEGAGGPVGGDGWSAAAVVVLDADGRMRILNERCTTCIIGGPRSITPTLRPGRLRQMIDDAGDGYIICHSTLSNTRPRAAVCRGWFDRFGDTSAVVRAMKAIDGTVFVPLLSEMEGRR